MAYIAKLKNNEFDKFKTMVDFNSWSHIGLNMHDHSYIQLFVTPEEITMLSLAVKFEHVSKQY